MCENWQAQHPPFYYALLTPAYLLSERWSLAGQLALLRGLSYLAAWLSLCLAVFVAAKTFPASGPGRAMIAAPALWPFVFPGWFPEMARLGNDSLVALLVACAVAVVTCAPIRRWSTWLLLGVICGLGALTKATFLPFLAVIALLLLYRTWRRDASPWQFLGFLATVIAVAGWWYFQRSVETGMLFATVEGIGSKGKGGIDRRPNAALFCRRSRVGHSSSRNEFSVELHVVIRHSTAYSTCSISRNATFDQLRLFVRISSL